MNYYPPNDHGSTDVWPYIELHRQAWNYKKHDMVHDYES